MKYLFAIDMDGTLLNDQSQLNETTKTYISDFVKDDHLVVLASGRSYLGMIDYYNELKLNTPLITLNGSAVFFPDGTVYETFFDQNLIKHIYDNLKDTFYSLMFNTSDGIHSYNHSYELEEIFNGASNNKIEEINFDKFDYDNVYNGIVIVYEEKIFEFENFFENIKVKPRYWGVKNGYAFYDIYLENISKATGLNEVIKYYNKSLNEVFTFGDGANDTEMLSINKNGVAMKNGLEVTKKAATHVTAHSNNNDGVVQFIKQLLKK